jgi:hypothetical protein
MGEKSRFQLFGDTVNTASRMESTGERDKIQASQSTANLLIEAGKGAWIMPRSEKIKAKVMFTSRRKRLGEEYSREVVLIVTHFLLLYPYFFQGKGELQTYWIVCRGANQTRKPLERCNSAEQIVKTESPVEVVARQVGLFRVPRTPTSEEKYRRMIEWQVDLLSQLLTKVVAFRQADPRSTSFKAGAVPTKPSEPDIGSGSSNLLEEASEVIEFPHATDRLPSAPVHPESVQLSSEVTEQLKDFVTTIAGLYRLNPFHNFEHATHVSQAVIKFLNRIESICEKESDQLSPAQRNLCSSVLDPLNSFAIVFSGLVHNVDHQGLSNAALSKEDPRLADFYHQRCVNEQNSFDVAWGVLMDSAYSDLQHCIFQNETEQKRFRQLVVSSVLSTDILDAQLKESRETRWSLAFQSSVSAEGTLSFPAAQDDGMDSLRAKVVLEHLMQAADVVHSMQHWHIYQKFNQMLFEETYSAFEKGRSNVDPSRHWFKEELECFDSFVIPLALKLNECNIFGVASQECLAYARANRNEWSIKGDNIVREMLTTYQQRKFQGAVLKTAQRARRRFSVSA